MTKLQMMSHTIRMAKTLHMEDMMAYMIDMRKTSQSQTTTSMISLMMAQQLTFIDLHVEAS
nr:MAG TPA: hypothetical protein [Caudoviricetes sp.]